MIRTTTVDDKPTLLEMAWETNVFRRMEIDALGEVIDDFFAINQREGHRAITCEQNGRPIGFAYYAPMSMTDRTWNLYWIFVEKNIHAKGIGTQLLHHAEQDIMNARGRLLLIETSSLPSYDLTRRFYLKHGYEQAAVLRDFYVDGDDQVIFRKRLAM